MKHIINKPERWLAFIAVLLLALPVNMLAQNDTTAAVADEAPVVKKVKPAKNTFPSVWIIDNQTVTVPVKKTFEMDIMHRFGTINKGYKDLWGFFAPSNIRLGFNYSPNKKLNVGFGITKSNMLWDFNAKYAIITQTKGKYPVSVTWYSNMAMDSRDKDKAVIYDGTNIKHFSDRLLFFNQLLIARKITPKLSLQIAPSLTHQNAVSGYYTKNDSTGKEIYRSMKQDHFAIAISGRYKLTEVTALIFNYDQPLTKHPSYNPNPNLSFGFEFTTSSHSFQVFLGNYSLLNQQRNNLFNQNDPFSSSNIDYTPINVPNEFLIGFNITRLWNY
jgi:hypothetical protein